MSTVGGVGGSNTVFNEGLGGAQDVGSVDAARQVQVPGGPRPIRPSLALGAGGTGVTYTQPSPLEPSHLVLPSSINDSANVDITSCLVLLLQTAIEMRKDQREQWISQAQNALQTSNTAADLQLQAAKDKLIGECVTTGVQAAVSVASCVVSVVEAGKLQSAEADVGKQADGIYGTDKEIKSGNTKSTAGIDGDEDAGVQSQAKAIISEEGLTSSSLGGESVGLDEEGIDTQQKSLKNAQKVEAERVQTQGGTNETQGADTNNSSNKAAETKSADSIKEQLKAKADFKAKATSFEQAKIQAKTQALKSAIELGSSAAKFASAAGTYQSEAETAAAAKVKALADFQNTAASNQLDFVNELKDYASAILSTIRDVESARHAASNAIANI
jgi:hypothetical protein